MKTITSFIFNLSARILFTIISVISGFFLVRYLGPDQYGIVGIYTTLILFIPGITCFSYYDSYGKEFAQRGLDPKLFSEAIITMAAFGILLLILIISTVPLLNKIMDVEFGYWLYILVSVHLIIYLVNGMFERALEAIGKPQITSSVQFIMSFITITTVAYTIIFKEDYKPYLYSQLLFSLSSLITYIIYYKKTGLLKNFEFHFDMANFKRVSRYGFSIYLAGLFFMVSQRLPVFITQSLYGLAFVSFLNIPLNLYGRLYLPVYSLSTVLSPKFSSGDEKSNLKNFEYGLRLTLILFIPAMSFFIIGSQKLIPLLYGSKFVDAVIPAVILAPFLLFYAVDIFFNSTINYLGIADSRLKYIRYAGVIDVIAIVAGTAVFGFYGLISSFSISIIVLTVFDFYIIRKKVKIDKKIVLGDILRITACTAPIYIYCYFAANIGSVLYLAGCCAVGVVYLLFIFVTGVIDKSDISVLLSSFRLK